jgi:PAS domain S-box-containing protein/putative nucleotidyltransferase with HDIG domain
MPRKSTSKAQKQLLAENEELRARLEEAEETLRAIRSGEVDALVVSGTDGVQILTFKQVEEALRVSEEKYRTLVDEVNDGFYVVDKAGVFTFANPAMARIYGMESPQTLVGRKFMDFIVPEKLAELSEKHRSTMHTGPAPEVITGQIVRPDGTRAFIEIKPVSSFKEGRVTGSRGVVRDITARKQAEQEIVNLAKFPSENPNPVLRLNRQGIVLYANAASEAILGSWGCAVGGSAPQFWRDLAVQALTSKKIKTIDVEYTGKVYAMTITPVAPGGYMNIYGRDITERKRSADRIQRQLEHLTAISTIDRFIASIFDLNLSLAEILTHVTKELGIDAADILLLNSNSQILEYAAGRGFRTDAVKKSQVHLGEGGAGRAALERHLVKIQDLGNEPDNVLLTTRLRGEGFVSYFCVPLIFKGKVNGVLEIFHRLALEPDPEWFDFLNTLAGQAAIAIENTSLFETLQRSNSDLFLAYDATIEGWSRALDLRDKETEGHTQRVTEMTVKLGRLFGLGEAELVHVRWGALLHDIGKMGVPDRILLKPGPLTDKEWLVMKKHPAMAFEMLSSIHYLQQALDIPYCHHEKWDGSGYPRGLIGTQIPLVARIFAVVDVWDALRSDRPYRPAWTKEKVRQHMRASSGTHFDPKVVDAFMQILD